MFCEIRRSLSVICPNQRGMAHCKNVGAKIVLQYTMSSIIGSRQTYFSSLLVTITERAVYLGCVISDLRRESMLLECQRCCLSENPIEPSTADNTISSFLHLPPFLGFSVQLTTWVCSPIDNTNGGQFKY